MTREWKPGDVAMIPGCGPRMMTDRGWASVRGDFIDFFAAPRPLVVIDPEDREQVERLRLALDAEVAGYVSSGATGIALRSLIEPPLPEEPEPFGARVVDSASDEWARRRDGKWACLTSQAGLSMPWAELVERYSPIEVVTP